MTRSTEHPNKKGRTVRLHDAQISQVSIGHASYMLISTFQLMYRGWHRHTSAASEGSCTHSWLHLYKALASPNQTSIGQGRGTCNHSRPKYTKLWIPKMTNVHAQRTQARNQCGPERMRNYLNVCALQHDLWMLLLGADTWHGLNGQQ